MRDLPSITNSNIPKEPSVFDKAIRKAKKDTEGWEDGYKIYAQQKSYAGGQFDLFPDLLRKHHIYVEQ